MVTPGRYRHFKGGYYQVLFVARYALVTLPQAAQKVQVVAFARALRVTDKQYESDTPIVEALWVGDAMPTLAAPEVVVYADSDGVYARTLLEFEETVTNRTVLVRGVQARYDSPRFVAAPLETPPS